VQNALTTIHVATVNDLIALDRAMECNDVAFFNSQRPVLLTVSTPKTGAETRWISRHSK
jgi:hypothetical protein